MFSSEQSFTAFSGEPPSNKRAAAFDLVPARLGSLDRFELLHERASPEHGQVVRGRVRQERAFLGPSTFRLSGIVADQLVRQRHESVRAELAGHSRDVFFRARAARQSQSQSQSARRFVPGRVLAPSFSQDGEHLPVTATVLQLLVHKAESS